MKVIFIPFNNYGFSMDEGHQDQIMKDIFDNVREHHLGDKEKALVLIYLSDPRYHFMGKLGRFPHWVTGANVIVRKLWKRSEAEKMALELAGGEPRNVVLYRLVPEGMLTDTERHTRHMTDREKWDWSYCLDVEVERV